MYKKVVFIEIVLLIVVIVSNESRADIMSELGNLANLGQCGMNVNNDPEFKNCKQKVTENWRLQTDMKKQSCCKPMDFLTCSIDTAKKMCSESEANSIKTTQEGIISKVDTLCTAFRENPSLCGTNAILPLLSLIIGSLLLIMKFP